VIECALRAPNEAEKALKQNCLRAFIDPEPSLTVGLMPRDPGYGCGVGEGCGCPSRFNDGGAGLLMSGFF
jgi:hypothetical protein